MPSEFTHADRASRKMIERAAATEMETVWDRFEHVQPQCKFGKLGVCCRICNMGPCRIGLTGKKPHLGACGADVDTIAARNVARMIAAGAAAQTNAASATSRDRDRSRAERDCLLFSEIVKDLVS